MVVVAQLTALLDIVCRVAIRAGILVDSLEIAGIGLRVEVVIAAGEIGLHIQYMADSTALFGLIDRGRAGAEYIEVSAVREFEIFPCIRDVACAPADREDIFLIHGDVHGMTFGAGADPLLGIDQVVPQGDRALARVIVLGVLRGGQAELDPILGDRVAVTRGTI